MIETKSEGKLTYTVKETAKELNVCERTVWELIKSGELPHMKIGRRVLVPSESLRTYIKERTTCGKQEITAREYRHS